MIDACHWLWDRRVVLAFVVLTMMSVFAVWLTQHNAKQAAARNRKLILAQHRLSTARVVERKKTEAKICLKVDRLDEALLKVVGTPRPALKPGEYGYDYWVHHANEPIGRPGSQSALQLRAAKDVLSQLRKAACDPSNLTKGGTP